MKRQRRVDWNDIHRRLRDSREALARLSDNDRARQELILRERAAALAATASAGRSEAATATAVRALVFDIAGERYAFDTTHVKEVCAMMPLTPVPGAPGHVVGVAALHGEVLSVVDLRSLLDLPLSRLADPAAIIVLRGADMEFGVLAEAIAGIETYPLQSLQHDLLAVQGGSGTAWLLGVAPDRTAVLDAARLLADPRLVVEAD